MLSTTKAYLCSAFMSWANLSNIEETPSWALPIISKRISSNEKWNKIKEYIGQFVDSYVMQEFDIEQKWRKEQERKEQQKQDRQQLQMQVEPNQTFLRGTWLAHFIT